MDVTAEGCAQELLETVPLAMRAIRAEMRSRRTGALSVPQFRALLFVDSHAGSTLSALSDHLGRTPATVSKLVEGMVAAGLVVREVLPADRRKIRLELTPAGRSILTVARRGTLARLSKLLHRLEPKELGDVLRAMEALRRLFEGYALE